MVATSPVAAPRRGSQGRCTPLTASVRRSPRLIDFRSGGPANRASPRSGGQPVGEGEDIDLPVSGSPPELEAQDLPIRYEQVELAAADPERPACLLIGEKDGVHYAPPGDLNLPRSMPAGRDMGQDRPAWTSRDSSVTITAWLDLARIGAFTTAELLPTRFGGCGPRRGGPRRNLRIACTRIGVKSCAWRLLKRRARWS